MTIETAIQISIIQAQILMISSIIHFFFCESITELRIMIFSSVESTAHQNRHCDSHFENLSLLMNMEPRAGGSSDGDGNKIIYIEHVILISLTCVAIFVTNITH